MSTRFNLLALSGGGFLGLYTAKVLAMLEEKSKKPVGKSVDLLAGTSIGGIIALGLAAQVKASTIYEAFKDRGPLIFPYCPEPVSIVGRLCCANRVLAEVPLSPDRLIPRLP